MCVVSAIYKVKDRPVLAQKIPYYVTYDPKYVQIDIVMINIFDLYLITKCLWFKRYKNSTSSPSKSTN